jgi:hypothetical protein
MARGLFENQGLEQLFVRDYRMQQIDPASKTEIQISAKKARSPVMLQRPSFSPRCRRSRQSGEILMTKFSRRISANMEVVLDEVFVGVPHGGDHESRKYVAEKLIQSAGKGNVTLDGLRAVGRDAFRRLSIRKFA